MEYTNWRKRSFYFFGLLLAAILIFLSFNCSHDETTPTVRRVLTGIRGRELRSSFEIKQKTQKHRKVVIIDNGLVELTFSDPNGDVIGIKYNGINNLLEVHNKDDNRGYWDLMWGEDKVANRYAKLHGTKFHIIKQDENQIEISFSKTWNDSSEAFPINLDKRYIMLRNYPGFYSYAILEHPKEAPAAKIGVIRSAFKLQDKTFNYMAISDDRQRIMPSPRDRSNGHKLAYPEAVLLTDPSNPELKGEIDDKYQYSSDHKDIKVHGWISSDPNVGFWIITPSHEFLSTGPTKQELTSHVGPTSLSVFLSCHYAGKDLMLNLDHGESWKKVFGPISIYLNSISSDNNFHSILWENAKTQAEEEIKNWPYDFVNSEDFPFSHQRGTVSGQLQIHDRYINESLIWANSAYVGLASPGKAGSWQMENKGYQFWVQADEKGRFSIKNVRPGTYNLYAWVPGIIGDYVYEKIITIEPGSEIKLMNLIYKPPRNGPTLWEIGIPDRTAAEFFVPDPLPKFENKLFRNQPKHKFRQYGLWDRYTDLYPDNDLVYTIGVSNYQRDWYFAHVNRNMGNDTYEQTTWQIKFELESVMQFENYTLQLALASATGTDLQVRFNDPTTYRPVFSTHLIGRDNSIARHGIHGLYRLHNVNFVGSHLRSGHNTLYLTQSRSHGPFGGLLYDYIRLEAPPNSNI